MKRTRRLRVTLLLVAMMILTSCGKTKMTNNEATTAVSAEIKEVEEEKVTEEATEEETTEEVVEDDYTKHGIWKHEIEPHVYEYFVMQDDGTGFLIWDKNISEIKWSYSVTLKRIDVTFKEWNTYENYEIEENNNVVMMKTGNYTFIFMGNDKEEEQKMIADAQELSGNGEEKVDGATIIKKNYMTRKEYDTPLVMLDDEYITIEITAIFIDENPSENNVYAGFEYNVINHTDRFAWVVIYDYYINNTQVEINYSDIDRSFNNPLRGEGKALNKNMYGFFDTMTLEELETLSFSVQLDINDSPNQISSSDQVYCKVVEFPK